MMSEPGSTKAVPPSNNCPSSHVVCEMKTMVVFLNQRSVSVEVKGHRMLHILLCAISW